jgi:hypothetical protein
LPPGEMFDEMRGIFTRYAFAQRRWFGDEKQVMAHPDILQVKQLAHMPATRRRKA